MTRPPIHPQPGFYEQLVNDMGYDPEKAPHYSHEQFMEERNHRGWLGYTLLNFDQAKKQRSKGKKGRA